MSEWFKSVLETFRDSGYAAFTSFVVSVIAICLAFISWLSSRRANRKLIAIEEARDIEKRVSASKACLTAHIVQEPSRTGKVPRYFLEIENTGDASARNIVIYLDGKPAEEHPRYQRRGDGVTVIGPRSSARCQLLPEMGTRNPQHVRLTWTDDSESEGRYENTLS